MSQINEFEIHDIITRLQQGQPIPEDYQYKLFPVKQKEYELVYGGKMRKEDVLANEDGVLPVPLQIERIFNGNREGFPDGWKNMIVFGDNLQFLKTIYENKDPLIENKVKGKVKLIYIDPPFGTGDEYDGNKGQKGYTAKAKGAEFVEFIRRRLIVAKEILADDGSIFIRQDYHFGHYIKIVMDEVFGKDNLKNEIVINRVNRSLRELTRFNVSTECIFFYSKTSNSSFSNPETTRKCSFCGNPKKPIWEDLTSPGLRNPPEREFYGKTLLPRNGRHFTYTQERIDQLEKEGRLRLNYDIGYYDLEGNKIVARPEYLQTDNIPIDNNWTDIKGYGFANNYPAENSEELLKRIILTASKEGDIVLDFFAGSGTTAAVAEKLGRKWIVCDIGKLSFYTMQKRMLKIDNSKDLEFETKKYKKSARSFMTINTGYYDLEKVFKLKTDEYTRFVMELFEIEPLNFKKIGGISVDGQKKDGYYCMIFPYWKFNDAAVDIDYLEDLHTHIGEKIGNRFYIIAPANYVDFISDYYEIDNIRYYFLKVPYQVIRELHKVQFKKFRQPQRKNNVNDLDNAIGFHFIRHPQVDSVLSIEGDKVEIRISKFISEFAEGENDKEMQNFESLSMIMLDRNYNGKEFIMDTCYFAEDLLPKKKRSRKVDEDEDTIREELRRQIEIVIPSLKKSECGEKVMLIYVDIFGNEFKEELQVK